ncbi:MAG: hypothetical protein A2341_20370 [Deltaproteobacteria bacterium RIFOXYB12_FULL_58_9]|nr:MAG: hypothetical protein A2341_20370 [Deltaproteobacteria bacterium RIFOXYB12_FULL_58_9]
MCPTFSQRQKICAENLDAVYGAPKTKMILSPCNGCVTRRALCGNGWRQTPPLDGDDNVAIRVCDGDLKQSRLPTGKEILLSIRAVADMDQHGTKVESGFVINTAAGGVMGR